MSRFVATCSLGLAILGGASPASAQGDLDGRWAVRLQGEMLHDRGDLRLDRGEGRLLLESLDTTWLAVDRIEFVDASVVRFRITGHGLFIGALSGDSLTGLLHGPDASPSRFLARRLTPGSAEWPVSPRVRFREIIVGSDATSSRFPDAWRARLISRQALLAEHARLAHAVGVPPAGLVEITQRAQALVLGERDEGRRLAVEMLEGIARTPAADGDFRRIFGRTGAWRIDIHQVALDMARGRVGDGHILPDRLGEALQASGILPPGPVDPAQVRRALWELARRQYFASRGGDGQALPANDGRLLGVRAVVDAYVDARKWWVDAVDWLLERSWVETAAGWRSPRALVAEFWGTPGLVVPRIVPTSFGGMQAVPVIGLAGLDRPLVEPANAVAAEWLATEAGMAEAFEAWRGIDAPGVTSLPVVVGATSMMLRDPGEVVRSRLGGFVAAADRVLIDPTILPVFAVGTVVHEWQHLLFAAARLHAPESGAWQDHAWGVHLFDGDPWLAEGAAEWATEQVFASSTDRVPTFAFVEAEKRLALGAERPDDTHVLGYLLVRAVANRVDSPHDARDLLIQHLAEPLRLAETVGLGGVVSSELVRLNTLMVIPELTFVPDGGASRDVRRRLLVPDFTPEPE